jgi:hypothetical protein
VLWHTSVKPASFASWTLTKIPQIVWDSLAKICCAQHKSDISEVQHGNVKGKAGMVEGFWIVQYEGVAGNGGGVAVFIKGRVFGGDSGFVYTGTYNADEKSIAAKISVRNFLPDVPRSLSEI